ncbi:MAG: D-tyrosyl-tRNA(Tyr) deacylase [Chitinophagaceae bacterium]|nr:D-tyrosyl-tRNA(Tyr) deacylase [Chitinophagaceae bacterium]
MRAVIQRVSHASVRIDEKECAAIGSGLLVLLGIEENDQEEDIQWLSAKIANLRIFQDESGLMNRALHETAGDILLISQFTLFASTKKGNRPSFLRSAKPVTASPLYEKMIAQLEKDSGQKIQTGRFGADMQVSLCNDGPVTIMIDSKNKE